MIIFCSKAILTPKKNVPKIFISFVHFCRHRLFGRKRTSTERAQICGNISWDILRSYYYKVRSYISLIVRSIEFEKWYYMIWQGTVSLNRYSFWTDKYLFEIISSFPIPCKQFVTKKDSTQFQSRTKKRKSMQWICGQKVQRWSRDGIISQD